MTNFTCTISREDGTGFPHLEVVGALQLQSHYDDHHKFTLQVSPAVDEDISREDIKAIIGEKIIIRYENDWGSGCFIGYIDELETILYGNGQRNLVIYGYSPTTFLDCGQHFRTFADKSSGAIAEQLLQPYQRYFGVNGIHIAPSAYQGQIDYTIQPRVSDQTMLNWLADNSGTQEFFYDGSKLWFADLTSPERNEEETIELRLNANLLKCQLKIGIAPLDFLVHTYDYINGRALSSESSEINVGSNLVGIALEKSRIFPREVISTGYTMVNGLDKITKATSSAQAHELVQLSGTSVDARIKVGSSIRVYGDQHTLNGELAYQLFTVIAVSHQYQVQGKEYENAFVAVPMSLPFNLRMTCPMPSLGTMAAIVVDNQDPKYLGRVKVKFVGDTEETTSPWLRVLQPFTGGGGFFAVPQEDDCVMVVAEGKHHQHGMMVLGSFYHASNTARHWPHGSIGLRTPYGGLLIKPDGQVVLYGEDVHIPAKSEVAIDSLFIKMLCDIAKSPA